METTAAELRTKGREREENEVRSKKRKKRKGKHYILQVRDTIIGIVRLKRR